MASEIDGGGAPPSGGNPPNFRGRFRALFGKVAPAEQGANKGPHKLGTPGARPLSDLTPRRTPGYSTAGQSPIAQDPGRAGRMAEARQKGQAALSNLERDAAASAEFAQATKGASAKHLQNPYQPSNDLQRFATDLEYTTPAIDTPRYGAQPITPEGAREFVKNSAIVHKQIAAVTPQEGAFEQTVRSVWTAIASAQPIQFSPEFLKDLSKMGQFRDNPSALHSFKSLLKAVSKGPPQALPKTNGTADANTGLAPRKDAQAKLVLGAAAVASAGAGAGASAGAGPSTAGPMQAAPLGGQSGSAPVSFAAQPNPAVAQAAEVDASNAQDPVGTIDETSDKLKAGPDDTSLRVRSAEYWASLPWDAFIAKFKRENFNALMARLVLRGESQALTAAAAMAVGQLSIGAAKEKRDVEQFDTLMQLGISTLYLKQKLRDLNDANLDQGTKLNPYQQELDKYPFLTNDDARARASVMDVMQQHIAQAEAMAPIGQHIGGRPPNGPNTSFRMLAPSEIRALEAQGPQGRELATQIREAQTHLESINRRAVGLTFIGNMEEAMLRRKAAHALEQSPQGQTALGRDRIKALRSAAGEFDSANKSSGETFATVVEASKRTVMQLSVINRTANFNGYMKQNLEKFDQLQNKMTIAVRAGDAATQQSLASEMFAVRNGLETQMHQFFSMSSQLYWNMTSTHDNRMAHHRSGNDAFVNTTNALWSTRGPALEKRDAASALDLNIKLDRAKRNAGNRPTPAQQEEIDHLTDQRDQAQSLEEAKMTHARLATTTSAFAAATLDYRYDELTKWFGGKVEPQKMETYLTQGVTRADLVEDLPGGRSQLRAEGLRAAGYGVEDVDHLLAYSKQFSEATGGRAVQGQTREEPERVSVSMTSLTKKAQVSRHYSDRKEAIADGPGTAAEKQAKIDLMNERQKFFEGFKVWSGEAQPGKNKIIERELKAFETQEILNKSAWMIEQGFRPTNTSENVQHNTKLLWEKSMPKGDGALNPWARTAQLRDCYGVTSGYMTQASIPTDRLRRLEQVNMALMFTSTSAVFSSQNDLLMNHLSEDAGELENLYAELSQKFQEDQEPVLRMFETLNQSLAVVPGG